MTWEETKIATLQRMFVAIADKLVVDETTKDYLAYMPEAANEGLQRIAAIAGYKKSYKIITSNHKNILSDSEEQQSGTSFSFRAKAKSYYLELNGAATITIMPDDDPHKTIETAYSNGFTVYKGNILNASNAMVTININATVPANIRNVAMYSYQFENESDIPSPTAQNVFDLKKLIPDFARIESDGVYFDENKPLGKSCYEWRGDSTLIINTDKVGEYTIHYQAYPPRITAQTPGAYVMPLTPEEAVILPLYMASVIYKDDDLSIATGYRNEFEVALESIVAKNKVNVGCEEFTSEWV